MYSFLLHLGQIVLTHFLSHRIYQYFLHAFKYLSLTIKTDFKQLFLFLDQDRMNVLKQTKI